MGLSSAGIGSNLDVEGIITKLMSVERQPLTKLARQEASYQAKLSGFGTLKGALSQFQTAVRGLADVSKFQGVSVSAADATIATASATSSAAAGTYALKVTQLAQAQKLVAAGTASDIAPVGKGVISIDFGTITGGTNSAGKYAGATFASAGSGVKTIVIDDSNNSLAGIRDAINKAAIGVTATIVNDGGSSPYRLALTSQKTGEAASMKISVADTAPGNGLSGLLANDPAGVQSMAQTSAAQNAQLTIDGIAVSKASNAISDVIGGVTLNLLKTNPDTATAITIARDTASVTTAVNTFVKAYNDISQNLRDAGAYNAATKTAAILNGEASVRAIQTQVRTILTSSVAGGASAFSRLSEIGVTLQKDGLLAVDNTKLSSAMSTNFSDFAGLFAAAGKSGDSLVSYTGFSPETLPGAYGVNVTQLASKGSTSGNVAAGTAIDGTNNTLDVVLNGVTATITLTPKASYTAAELAAEVQSKINGAVQFSSADLSATVTQSGGTLTITSNKFGSASKVSITGGSARSDLGFPTNGSTELAGADVKGTINGAPATGNGQKLTSDAGSPSAGLALTVAGGSLGARGTVNFSQGYAFQFDKLATTLLAGTGSLAARTDGITASIKGLDKSKDDLNTRLAMTEKRYRAQFTALDLIISKMNTTSTFLSQQLAQISSLSSR
ncbi:MAG: flagellar filament capping protein FliD [Massilia sp.]|nr:flagellar filament capping protein FliD [Massilia sp.]